MREWYKFGWIYLAFTGRALRLHATCWTLDWVISMDMQLERTAGPARKADCYARHRQAALDRSMALVT